VDRINGFTGGIRDLLNTIVTLVPGIDRTDEGIAANTLEGTQFLQILALSELATVRLAQTLEQLHLALDSATEPTDIAAIKAEIARVNAGTQELQSLTDSISKTDLALQREQIGKFAVALLLINQEGGRIADIMRSIIGVGEVGDLNAINRFIEGAERDFKFGGIDTEELNAQLAKSLLQIDAAISETTDEQDIQDYVKRRNDILLQMFENDVAIIQRDDAEISLINNAQRKLEVELAQVNRLLDQFDTALIRSDFDTFRDLQQQRIEIEKSLADLDKEETLDLLRLRADFGKTRGERLNALATLVGVLTSQLVTETLSSGLIDIGAVRAVAEAQRAAEEELIRQRTDLARLRILQANPALSEIAAIRANIAAINVQIDNAKDPVDEELLLLERRKLLAQLLQREAARRAAAFRLNAGVNDAISQAQVDIAIAAEEVALATELFGVGSRTELEALLKLDEAKETLASTLREFADVQRRIQSDLTDPVEQAALDLIKLGEALSSPNLGALERASLEVQQRQAELALESARVQQRLADLDFANAIGDLGLNNFIQQLRALANSVDRSTREGEEIWRSIQLKIKGLIDSTDLAFNIPTEIVLPTLLEVRRALAADQLGVNYNDNRQQNITIEVSDTLELDAVLAAIEGRIGSSFSRSSRRNAPGRVTILNG